MERKTSYDEYKDAILLRPRRQDRGAGAWPAAEVQVDRYSLDVVRQINALLAAGREVALLVLEDHLRGCIAEEVQQNEGEAAIRELITVLGKALRR